MDCWVVKSSRIISVETSSGNSGWVVANSGSCGSEVVKAKRSSGSSIVGATSTSSKSSKSPTLALLNSIASTWSTVDIWVVVGIGGLAGESVSVTVDSVDELVVEVVVVIVVVGVVIVVKSGSLVSPEIVVTE